MDFEDFTLLLFYALVIGVIFLLLKTRIDKAKEKKAATDASRQPVLSPQDRIAEICSDLDDIKKTLEKPAWIGAVIAISLVSYACNGDLSMLGRCLFFFAGCVLLIASVFVSIYADKCIEVMTKVMRYYNETKYQDKL